MNGTVVSPRISWLMLLWCCAMFLACSGRKQPPEADLSWLAPRTRSAKPPDCAMPLLAALPATEYQEVATVEVTGDYDAADQELLSLARRKACETGADALVILEDQRQKAGEPLPGFSSTEGQDIGPQSGSNVRAREHAPEVGELGHKGRIVDAVAVIYRHDQR
jgi:hypothetical protein